MNGTSDNGGTWTALGSAASLTANVDIVKVGSGSISCRLDGGASGAQGGMQITRGTAIDFDDSGTTRGMVAVWVQTTSVIGSGGIRLFVGSDASNFHEWIMATPDGSTGILYPGGWVRMVVDLDVTPDATTGSPDMANADYFAVEFDIVTDIMGNIQTIYIDQMDILTAANIAAGTRAFEVRGTTATSGNAITELAALSTVTDLGAIVETANGSFSLNMPVKMGDTTAATTSTITSTNEYIFIPNHRFEPGFCAIEFDGGTGTNTATWGAESGSGDNTLGATGGAIRGINDGTNGNFQIICDASDATTVLAGVVIDGADSISLTNTNVRLVSCTLVNCGTVTLNVTNGATLRDSVVTDSIAASGTGAVLLVGDPGSTADFRDMLIQNCTHAIENEANGPISRDLRNVKFANNTADIRHNGTGDLTINNLEGSDATTESNGGGGDVIFVNAAPVTITCKDGTSGNNVEGVRVWIDTDPPAGPSLFEGETNASGVFSATHTGSTPQDIVVRTALKGYRTLPEVKATIVASTGVSVPITMIRDPVVDR